MAQKGLETKWEGLVTILSLVSKLPRKWSQKKFLLPEEPPKGIVSCNIRWQELYVFLVYASRSLFASFDDDSLQTFKREREQDYLHFRRQHFFLSGTFIGLHSLSFLRFTRYTPFGFSSLYDGLRFFSGQKEFFISLYGQEMDRTGIES